MEHKNEMEAVKERLQLLSMQIAEAHGPVVHLKEDIEKALLDNRIEMLMWKAYCMGQAEALNARPPLRRFAHHMERILKKNDHKGGWGFCSLDYLREKLNEEVNELIYELLQENNIDIDKTRSEAVDVANVCMMIHDNLSKGRF